jgi:hypothetical protein
MSGGKSILESYSDEELMASLAGDAPPASGVSAYSDEELMASLAGDKPPSGATRSWEEPPGLGSRVVSKLGEAYQAATNPEYSMSRKAVRSLGTLGEAAADVGWEAAKGALNFITTPETKEGLKDVGGYLAGTDFVKAQGATLRDFGRVVGALDEAYPETMTDIKKGIQIPNLLGVYGAAKITLPAARVAAKTGLNIGKSIASGVADVAEDVASSKPARWMTGRPDAEGAMKQVLQSKAKELADRTADLAKGSKAFGAIDTTGVKSAEEIIGKFNARLPELRTAVDEVLLKDPGVYKLDDLATVGKTTSGKEVPTNYVKTALDHMKELYATTGAPVKAANMDELLAKAEKTGLTKKEVNDIARKYNGEFGDKAFNADDVPLTSVNSEAYRNVQQGLKEVAQRGLDDTAKELDSTMSAIYNTRRLMERNAKAAAELRAKYDERGIGQKVGGAILTAMDIATLGIAKGAAMKVIPRGWGLKLRNAADIDEMYGRNLKIIKKEIERVDKMKLAGPTGPLEGRPPEYATRGFRGNERLGQPSIGYNPIPPGKRPPVPPTIDAEFEYIPPTQRTLRAPYETPLQLEGQGFTLPEGLPYPPVKSTAIRMPYEPIPERPPAPVESIPPRPGTVPPPAEIVQPAATSGGKQEVLYHGTNAEYADAEITTGKKMYGIHLTTDEAVAKDYGQVKKYVLSKDAKTLDLSDPDSLWEFMKKEGILDEQDIANIDLENYTKNGQLFQYDISGKTHLADDVAKTAESLGYDVVKMPDDLGGRGDNIVQVVVNKKALQSPSPLPAPSGGKPALDIHDVYEKYDGHLDSAYNNILSGAKAAKEGEIQKWNPIPLSRIKHTWQSYSELGFVRNARVVDDIADDIVQKIATLDANTTLMGHTPIDPVEALDAYGLKMSNALSDKLTDYLTTEKGNWRISDYGLEKLQKIAVDIIASKTPEEKLLLIDRVLNVVHQREDLAAWFVEGGRNSLDELAGKAPITLRESKDIFKKR